MMSSLCYCAGHDKRLWARIAIESASGQLQTAIRTRARQPMRCKRTPICSCLYRTQRGRRGAAMLRKLY